MTRAELWGFIALILNMGIIQLPDIESYWKTSWVCQVPFFRDILPRDRFQEIFWMLHVGTPGVTARKIDKIKPLLDILLPRFQELYRPSQNLAIDETMVGFRGRFGSIQYMPQKPTKWGIKAFTLADTANGYLQPHLHRCPNSLARRPRIPVPTPTSTGCDGRDGPVPG